MESEEQTVRAEEGSKDEQMTAEGEKETSSGNEEQARAEGEKEASPIASNEEQATTEGEADATDASPSDAGELDTAVADYEGEAI